MNYKDLQNNDSYEERLSLVIARIAQIAEQPEAGRFSDFFRTQAKYLQLCHSIAMRGAAEGWQSLSEEEGSRLNQRLHEGLCGAEYETSYGNPAYAEHMLGEEYGPVFCVLYHRLRIGKLSLFEGELEKLCLYAELFVELYNACEEPEVPAKTLRRDLASFLHDNAELFCADQVSRSVDPDRDYVFGIVMEADLSDPAYLYRYGLYVGENERRIAAFLNTRSDAEIQAMADTYTEGYRIGFLATGKDITIKSTVQIRYPIGFERMIRAAVINFEGLGLRPVFLPYSTPVNKQYDFDHKEDEALWLDKAFADREAEAYRQAFEDRKALAAGVGGPAVVEVFGEEPFSPETKKERIVYDKKQQELSVRQRSEMGQIRNRYIIGEERSFTVIAYPLPSIGEHFEEIFAETVKINTLDYQLYQTMQQRIIDVLDTADRVHIQGTNGNRTDLYVNLYKLKDPSKETIFENCVADVNIPVGEVFTSPVLSGTNGRLHVSQVYLNELNYENLELEFTDGMISSYTCTNFDSEEENRKYIQDNVLFHHETLPMGEFAIGTNTTAFRMARVYRIADKLPILIAEKTGPHFAVGDTCYTYDEENMTYNPDGKAIVARDNEVSILRREDVSKAYFNCHTDITIPYGEIGTITAIRKDGSTQDIIRNGRFVVPGTEELNAPLEELEREGLL